MLEKDITTDEIWETIEKLEQVIGIAKASRLAMHTSCNVGLDSEEISSIFDGIVSMVDPIKVRLYEVHEVRGRG
jgi:hypothetical protein